MAKKKELSIEFLNKTSRVLKLLAHPYRLKIIEILEDENEGMTVSQIIDSVQISQSSVSQHLNAMQRVGLIKSQRHGKNICYKIADKTSLTILNCIRSKNDKNDINKIQH